MQAIRNFKDAHQRNNYCSHFSFTINFYDYLYKDQPVRLTPLYKIFALYFSTLVSHF